MVTPQMRNHYLRFTTLFSPAHPPFMRIFSFGELDLFCWGVLSCVGVVVVCVVVSVPLCVAVCVTMCVVVCVVEFYTDLANHSRVLQIDAHPG